MMNVSLCVKTNIQEGNMPAEFFGPINKISGIEGSHNPVSDHLDRMLQMHPPERPAFGKVYISSDVGRWGHFALHTSSSNLLTC